MAKVNLGEAVNYLLKVVKNHIGKGGDDVHLPVDSDISGFMTPDLLKKLNEASGNGTYIDSTSIGDFTQLKNGFYETGASSSDNNAPTIDGVYHLQVTGIQGRRHIIALHSYTGTLYAYSLHTYGTQALIPTGWRQIPQRKVVWKGDASGEGTQMTMTDALSLFKTVIIQYNYVGNYYSREVSAATLSRTGVGITAMNLTNATTEATGHSLSELVLTPSNSGKTLTISHYKSVFVTGAGAESINADKINIYCIWGIL